MKATLKFNKHFRQINESKKRYRIFYGSAGSGKSIDIAQDFIMRLIKTKGNNLLCVRKTKESNKDSTFAELQKVIYKLFQEKDENGNIINDEVETYWDIKTSPLEITYLPNGNSIIFRGCNDARQIENIKSITFKNGSLTFIWIEEATELTATDIDVLDDRLRGQLPNGLYFQLTMSFNPISATHHIKRNFFDRYEENCIINHSTYLDNKYIDEAYKDRMMRRKELDPEGYEVYGLGNWGNLEGIIFSNYQQIEVNTDLNYYDDVKLGQDFGFNHANAILLLGIKDNEIYIIREFYEFNKDTNELVTAIKDTELYKILLKNEALKTQMKCDSAEPDRIRMWSRAGYNAVPCYKKPGSVKSSIDWIKQRRIFIDNSCLNTLTEIGQWRWQKDRSTGKYIDVPVAFGDDAMAALRYGCENWFDRGQQKPKVEEPIKTQKETHFENTFKKAKRSTRKW